MLMNENKDLKQALEDSKKRLDASKARCRVLETECNNIRIKLSTISDQAEKDHELITSLMVINIFGTMERTSLNKHYS